MRIFVAIPLPQAVRARLGMMCAGLPEIRWVPPDNMHLTLRFIGEVDGVACDDVAMALATIRAPRFRLELAGVGHFGGGNRVRALWAGVAREPALLYLRDKVESAVVRAGVAPDGQKFTPHVTLGRGKGAPVRRLEHFLAEHSLFRSAPFEVERFVLFSSFRAHTHAIYSEERSYDLLRP